MERPRILLTGFGPFPGVAHEPFGLACRDAGRGIARAGLTARFTCGFCPPSGRPRRSWPIFAKRLQPHVMIHFGVSEHAKTFRIERSAHNRTALRADAGGALPAARDPAEGPDRLDTALPAAALARHLKTNGVSCRDVAFRPGTISATFSITTRSIGPAPIGSSPRPVRARSASSGQRRQLKRRDAPSRRARDRALRARLSPATRGPIRVQPPGLSPTRRLLGAKDA